MKKFRVGIIGCGNIFPMHAYPVSVMENAEIIAICDNKEERAVAKAKEFGALSYTDYEKMIDECNLDVVHLCTPHYLHPIMAKYALSKKVNVMTEKPMGIDYQSCIEMVECAKQNGVTLGVILQNRYNAGSQLVKRLLDDGTLGKVKSAKCSVTWDRSDLYYSYSDWKGTWDKEGGGVIIDQAIHTIDLMHWLVNDEIAYIDASIANRAHEQIEVEDSAEGVIKYKNGVTASFFAINYHSYDAPIEIELHCENGMVKIIESSATVKLNDGRIFIAEKNPNETFNYGNVKDYWGVSHIKQLGNFYECLETGATPYITCEQALNTMQMIMGIYDSGKKKERIFF